MFRIAIPVVAGETYTLDGTVAGLRFRGSTVMPVTFRRVQTSDTLSLATLDNTPVPPDSSLRIYRVDILSQGIVEANTVLTVAERQVG